MDTFKRSKQDIYFSVKGNDKPKHARSKAFRYALAFGCVLLVGLVVIKSLVNILIGA